MKNFLGYLVVSMFAITMLFSSCEKDYQTRVCESPITVQCAQLPFDSSKVNVRMINATGYPLCDLEVVFEDTKQEVVKYGRFDVEDISCYTTFPLRNAKVFPEVSFNLGTGHYNISDSLIAADLPYGNLVVEFPGFYSYFILIADSLNSDTCRTFFQRDF